MAVGCCGCGCGRTGICGCACDCGLRSQVRTIWQKGSGAEASRCCGSGTAPIPLRSRWSQRWADGARSAEVMKTRLCGRCVCVPCLDPEGMGKCGRALLGARLGGGGRRADVLLHPPSPPCPVTSCLHHSHAGFGKRVTRPKHLNPLAGLPRQIVCGLHSSCPLGRLLGSSSSASPTAYEVHQAPGSTHAVEPSQAAPPQTQTSAYTRKYPPAHLLGLYGTPPPKCRNPPLSTPTSTQAGIGRLQG